MVLIDLVYELSPINDKTRDPETAYGSLVTSPRSRTWMPDDVPFLWEMLYVALHVRDGQEPFPRSVLHEPAVAHYLQDFGTRAGDDAQLAVDANGQPVGAAWVRRMTAPDPGYGYVADDIPELTMAVEAHWRGRGIGRSLLETMLDRHPRMSLSVDDENVGAIALYRSVGFVPITSVSGSTTMAIGLDPPSQDHIDSTRAVYDFSAAHYATAVGTTVSAAFERPIDRAILDSFAEDLLALDNARVLDVGCGVGRITSYLHDRGLDVRGVDLSPAMVATARSAHPHVAFEVSPMTALPVDDGSVTAVVLWYSIIHTPPTLLVDVWSDLARVVAPNGWVLVAFQEGDNDRAQRENAYGSSTTLTWYRHDTDDVVRGVEHAGFELHTRTWRAAELAHETTPQAFLIFQRRA